ncbi:MAG: YkgJ family cysteine cluster protein [Nitrospirota bacterium]|nr:YkgJ family cysteine cluster protein [Nitrospirota bacterium]MDH5585081.1 YkgJ family cysteine cluster protein [Nitrospirota bacterium]MDH5773520.1 YkgJ family cysteine cluster protein [Nitrospirota bacterium]
MTRDSKMEELARDSPFSYTCHQCSRCCYDKRIQVNPYEVARLAQNKGLSTTELIANYLELGKPYLDNQSDGACVFLTDQGCGVHADRPLVCRIYPLEQRLTGEGRESFHYARPHPETEGMYGQAGTVKDFLMAQGLPPFLEVRDRYVAVVYRLLDILAQDVEDHEDALETAKDVFSDDASIQQALGEWLDMDVVVARHCQAHRLNEPFDLEERLTVYLEVMEDWINHHSIGGNHENQT